MGLEINHNNGQTPLDNDELEGLKINSITTKEELDEFEQLNIEKALEWTIHTRFTSEKILTEQFIKSLHKRMYGEVWKWAGTFRKTNKNIGIEWTQIGIHLKSLLEDTKYWIENESYSQEEIAIRFKHRLVSIHCFPNGNGRHSRIMADLIMESIFGKKYFSWHHSTITKADETRKKYIAALKEADNQNIMPLLQFAKN